MMLHVSDLNSLKLCPVYGYKSRYEPVKKESFYDMPEPFSNLYIKKLHLENAPTTSVGDTSERTLELLENNDEILNARFSYRSLRCRIPVLIKNGTAYTAIYPHLSAHPMDFLLEGMKINEIAAANWGITISENKVLYVNPDYIREESIDPEKLLLVSDKLFNRSKRHTVPIDERLAQMEIDEIDLDERIDAAESALSQALTVKPLHSMCKNVRNCPYLEACFDQSKIEDDCSLFLSSAEKTGDGKEKMKEARLIEGTSGPLQFAQVMASKDNQTFYDANGIRNWLSQIEYPVSYLDFEWDTFAIPPYPGMKPFEVLCFQYSLHVEEKEGTLKHYDYFGNGDCRREFVERLFEAIPKTGSILVYNMEGAEKLRLKHLARQFPEYEEELSSIWERMIDLSKPFEQGLYYNLSQRGHFSLKKILPCFLKEGGYDSLEIRNGLNAVSAYRCYDKNDTDEQKKIREQISNYCAMDTYAEYAVLHGLEKLTMDRTGKE